MENENPEKKPNFINFALTTLFTLISLAMMILGARSCRGEEKDYLSVVETQTAQAAQTQTAQAALTQTAQAQDAKWIDSLFYLLSTDGTYTFLQFFPDGKVTTVTVRFDPPKNVQEAYQAARTGLDPNSEYAKVGSYGIYGSDIWVNFGGSWGIRSGMYNEPKITLKDPTGKSSEFVLYDKGQ